MATFRLNMSKPNNYAFFCPKSRLHLTVSNPVGSVNEVTPAIIRAVKNKTLLDIDGVIGNKSSQIKAEVKEAPKASVQPQEPVKEENSIQDEAVIEKKMTKKRGKRAATAIEESAVTE